MAIAFDATSSSSNSGSATLTYQHTCTGTNLFLGVSIYDQSVGDNVTGVTYNGVAMTKSDSQLLSGDGGTYQSLWYLFGPSTGINDIIVTRSSSANAMVAQSTSLTGCNQSAIDSHAKVVDAGSPSSLAITTTVVASNCWLVGGCRNGCGVITAGSGTTVRIAASSVTIGDSNGTVGTGSQSLNFNGPACGPSAFAACVLSIAPAPVDYNSRMLRMFQ